ncbi:hypothetical protein AX15_005969 [Amanita polypyramis BW_CC]|nr:hypothetical protein AX15_005969 [Amanita polypyramis BW_CC]
MALLPRLRAFAPRLSAPLLPLSRPPARYFRLSAPRLFAPAPRLLHPSPTQPPLPPNPSLSHRLKHLIKTYGWYALGVYIVISTLDFAVAFASINLLGADYVAGVAASAKAAMHDMFYAKPVEPGLDELDNPHARGIAAGPNGQEGLYAMLVLAYTVHKTLFLPVRVGLTAALTPRLVTWLNTRGWIGREGARRATKLKERGRRVDN